MLEICKTPESCEQFARNVELRQPERAQEARRKAVRLRAQREGARNVIEQECWEAVYAYERTLYKKHGKAQKAAYTRRMIRERGVVPAVEHTVLKKGETSGYRALLAEGMQDMAFEAVVLRHPEAFGEAAVTQSRERLTAWQVGATD
jgi:hypothetical protein